MTGAWGQAAPAYRPPLTAYLGNMADDIQTRLSAEGADPLLFAGVNDSNLLELQRSLGIRVSLRGDAVTLSGSPEQVERAGPVVQGLLDLARMGEPVTSEGVPCL